MAEFEEKYIIQLTNKSYCPRCNQNVHLLIHGGVQEVQKPMFYICFKCEKVYEIGVGEVPDVNLPEE